MKKRCHIPNGVRVEYVRCSRMVSKYLELLETCLYEGVQYLVLYSSLRRLLKAPNTNGMAKSPSSIIKRCGSSTG